MLSTFHINKFALTTIITIVLIYMQTLTLNTAAINKRNSQHGKVSALINVLHCFISSLIAFDLLRIDIIGFNLFCEYFLKKYPDYFVSPLRISGSAVETLFSQFKYSAGGKLDAANYSYSRAVCLVKRVSASHHSGKEYSDCQLDIPDLCMTKKIYNRKNAPK